MDSSVQAARVTSMFPSTSQLTPLPGEVGTPVLASPTPSCECCIAPATVTWIGLSWCGYHALKYVQDTPTLQWFVLERAPLPAFGRGVG